MSTSRATIAGMCFGSICLAALAANAADHRDGPIFSGPPPGNSAPGHKEEIEIDSFSWRATSGTPPAAQGGTIGAAQPQGAGPAPGASVVQIITVNPFAGGASPWSDAAQPPSSLGSLRSLGSMNEFFANSRSGDQGAGLLLPAEQPAREAARSSASGDSGCVSACQNYLNVGKPAAGRSVPTESFSLGYAKVQLNNIGPGVAAPKTAIPQITGVAPATGSGPGGGPQVFRAETGALGRSPGSAAQNLVRTR